jgi:GWxTD domain-containing protein
LGRGVILPCPSKILERVLPPHKKSDNKKGNEVKKNFYSGLLLGIFLVLLIISCAARSPFSPKNLHPKDQEEYELLKKAGATSEELKTYLLYHLTPTLESKKDSIWKEFWDKRYQTLTAEEKTIYHTLLSDSLFRLKYLSLKDEKTRRGFIEKLKDKKRNELVKTKEGKILYFSLKLLFSKEEMEEFLMTPDSLREEWLRIWSKKKDPDLTTEINEFKEKFDRRVQHVLTFYHTIFGQKPWDDRGDVYILYGEPDAVEQADYFSGYSGNFVSLNEDTFAMNQVLEDMKIRSQVWFYNEYGCFQFQDNYFDGSWELMPYQRQTSSKGSRAENMMALSRFLKTKTEKIDIATAEVSIDFGEPLNYAWDWWRFWNEGDTYEMEINFGIPLGKLGLLSDSLNPEIAWTDLEERVAIYDAASMEEVVRDSVAIRKKLPKNLNRKDLLLVDQFSWNFLLPGNYVISVSVKDNVTQKIGIYKDTTIILVPHVYATAQEKISRLVMADSIWVADSAYVEKYGGKFIRNSLVIVPHPGNVYLEGQSTPSYYCEVYGLKSKNDSTSTLIIYNILSQIENDEFVLYATNSEYASWPADGQSFLKGTVNLPKGEYIFHIIVYDLNDPKPKKEEVRETASKFIID